MLYFGHFCHYAVLSMCISFMYISRLMELYKLDLKPLLLVPILHDDQ